DGAPRSRARSKRFFERLLRARLLAEIFPMTSQSHLWSKAAATYEQDFIDPYLPGVRNPLPRAVAELADPQKGTVADLGCGVGPLLPLLAKQFRRVIAVDFAEGMLKRAREACADLPNVEF